MHRTAGEGRKKGMKVPDEESRGYGAGIVASHLYAARVLALQLLQRHRAGIFRPAARYAKTYW
jgi:hypothetical protein